jgi:Family of unknown function (DUF6311)
MVSKYITGASEPLGRRLDSVWTGLAISLIVGVLFTYILMGPEPLNPHNISWLTGDPAMYYTAWELFRQDPHWHWPLTYTTRIGYPLGENIALADPNPLFAVLLKPFSPVLPEPFQYFGIEVVLSYTLLFFFSMRLFRLILGPNLPAMLLCSLFFCLAPPLLWNTTRHFAVSNHWLLLAALLLYVQTQQSAPGTIRHFVIAGLALIAVAVATNPYLVFQVILVLIAATGSLLWQRRLSLVQAFGFLAALPATGAGLFHLWRQRLQPVGLSLLLAEPAGAVRSLRLRIDPVASIALLPARESDLHRQQLSRRRHPDSRNSLVGCFRLAAPEAAFAQRRASRSAASMLRAAHLHGHFDQGHGRFRNPCGLRSAAKTDSFAVNSAHQRLFVLDSVLHHPDRGARSTLFSVSLFPGNVNLGCRFSASGGGCGSAYGLGAR